MSPPSKNTASDSFNEIATVRIELMDSDPLIWRQVEVPTSITLRVLHDIVQAVMTWFDYHLWEFTIGTRRYGLPMDEDWGTEPRSDASKVRLRDVLNPRKTVIDYTYDFGDRWEHRLTVTDVRTAELRVSYPRYIAGEWNAPPEDCGGIPGFYEMLEALADPERSNHADAKEWLDDYDPKVIDEADQICAWPHRKPPQRRQVTPRQESAPRIVLTGRSHPAAVITGGILQRVCARR